MAGLTQELALVIKVDVDDTLSVALEGAFKLACFPVPDLDGGILGSGGEDGVLGMERDAGDGSAVACEDVRSRGAGDPIGLHGGALGGGEGELLLESGVSVFQIHDLGEMSSHGTEAGGRPFSADG